MGSRPIATENQSDGEREDSTPKTESKTVSIVGCGWLGLPLGKHLLAQGCQVHGSTTRREKLEALFKAGINAHHFVLPNERKGLSLESSEAFAGAAASLASSDVMVYNVPPSHGSSCYQIEEMLSMTSRRPHHLIFVSSTSVYGGNQGEVSEMTPPEPNTANGVDLLKTEKRLRELAESSGFALTILRLAGLVGRSGSNLRHPAISLSKRSALNESNLGNAEFDRKGEEAVNLIFLEDVIGTISQFAVGFWPDKGTISLFNVASNQHPSRREFYTEACKIMGVTPIRFAPLEPGVLRGKRVNSAAIRKALDYTFRCDDLFEATRKLAQEARGPA